MQIQIMRRNKSMKSPKINFKTLLGLETHYSL